MTVQFKCSDFHRWFNVEFSKQIFSQHQSNLDQSRVILLYILVLRLSQWIFYAHFWSWQKQFELQILNFFKLLNWLLRKSCSDMMKSQCKQPTPRHVCKKITDDCWSLQIEVFMTLKNTNNFLCVVNVTVLKGKRVYANYTASNR